MERNELLVTAALARLDPEPEELDRLEAEISRMLSYFELMQRFDASDPGFGANADARGAAADRHENRLRADTPGRVEDLPNAGGVPSAGVPEPGDRNLECADCEAASHGPVPRGPDREDAPEPGRDADDPKRVRSGITAGALLELAPELESGHIVIPNVL
jgi:Asp-tRNA(Asn)/Glu-tRNA(Gln) amidotransferase C subunit